MHVLLDFGLPGAFSVQAICMPSIQPTKTLELSLRNLEEVGAICAGINAAGPKRNGLDDGCRLFQSHQKKPLVFVRNDTKKGILRHPFTRNRNSQMTEDRKHVDRVFRFFDWVMALFVTVLIISNIASSAKIVDWGFSVFGLRFAFDAGTILFPVSYIFGDILTEVYGFKRSRRVIWTGFAMLALSAVVLWLVRIMPGGAM